MNKMNLDMSDIVTRDEILTAVAAGVFNVAANATDAPSGDFYWAVGKAVKEWMDDNQHNIIEAIKEAQS